MSVSGKPALAFLLLFPAFGAAVWTTYGQLFAAGAENIILKPDDCPYPPKYLSESQLRYTGIPLVDQVACIGVEFTKVGLFRHVQPFTVHFFATLSTFFTIFSIESLRADGPTRWFAYLITGFSMFSAAGIMMPLGWLYIFLSSKRDSRAPLTKGAAESLFLSQIFGYFIPTAVMISTVNEISIIAWSQSPFIIAILQTIWLKVRPPTGQSGFLVTQLALLTTLLTSTIVHLTMMISYAHRISYHSLVQWLPSWSIANAKALTTEAAILQFLQWDAFFVYLSGIVAGILYTDSWPELLLYAMAIPMVLLALGPGAVVSAMWMWREWKLCMLEEQLRIEAENKSKKTE
ncbi:hypothetical protein CPB86DRAFT_870895 [Serendipita vermifera]|nr:hypothetical protein CPB86DRAFT_870895 [Serendipita vermifera]